MDLYGDLDDSATKSTAGIATSSWAVAPVKVQPPKPAASGFKPLQMKKPVVGALQMKPLMPIKRPRPHVASIAAPSPAVLKSSTIAIEPAEKKARTEVHESAVVPAVSTHVPARSITPDAAKNTFAVISKRGDSEKDARASPTDTNTSESAMVTDSRNDFEQPQTFSLTLVNPYLPSKPINFEYAMEMRKQRAREQRIQEDVERQLREDAERRAKEASQRKSMDVSTLVSEAVAGGRGRGAQLPAWMMRQAAAATTESSIEPTRKPSPPIDRYSGDSKVVLLRNLAISGDEGSLRRETTERCAVFGRVMKCLIFESKKAPKNAEDAVRIFVEFDSIASASACISEMHDQSTAPGKRVLATMFPEARFKSYDFAPDNDT